jgi:hypothetical protein
MAYSTFRELSQDLPGRKYNLHGLALLFRIMALLTEKLLSEIYMVWLVAQNYA